MKTKRKAQGSASSTDPWNAEERSARMPFRFDDGSFHEQRLVTQFLDSRAKKGPTFSLYYFIKDQTYDTYEKPDEKPTILFAAGGPGQMILPDTENFADMYGYRVVYFHLRGSGFSQMPDDADQFLRTSYVVKDIEEIRNDLDVKQWTAVIGHSYGAVVAQRYASLYGDKVQKVILSAPMAPMSILRPKNDNNTTGETLTFESLRKIYKTNQFGFLDNIEIDLSRGRVREYLVGRAQEISTAIEKQYWSVQFAGDNYDRLKEQLKTLNLDYGVSFFGAIRRLRTVGWLPLDVPYAKPISTPKVDDTQVQCGLVIAKAILTKEKGFELEKVLKEEILKDKVADGERLLSGKSTLNTARPYYVVSINDGLSDKFLLNLQSGDDFLSVIRKFGGTNGSNRSIAKVIPSREKLKPWDPRNAPHDKPTLILKGGADPVTEQGQGEYYLDNALSSKERVLVEFPGVGHSMALPDLDPSDADLLKIPVKMKDRKGAAIKTHRILSPRDKLIDEFLRVNSSAAFKKAPIVEALSRAFEKCFADLDQGVANKDESRDLIVKTAY